MAYRRPIAGCVAGLIFLSCMSVALADTIKVESPLQTSIAPGSITVAVNGSEVSGLSTPSPQELLEAEQWMRLSSFIKVEKNGFVLDESSARKAGLPVDFLERATATYERLNAQLTKSGFAWDQFAANRQERIDSATSDHARLQATTQCDYLGCRLAFNEWETQLIINAVWTGAGAAGVYAALAAIPGVTLPAAGVLGLAAAILAFGGGYLGLVDTLGHNQGIYFGIRWVPWMVVVWHN